MIYSVLDDEYYSAAPKYVITEEPLKASEYSYVFVVTDIFGNKFYFVNALLEMTKTADKLKQNPLPGVEYA